MREIPMTKGQVAIVDDEDLEWLSQWKWSADWSGLGKCFYALRGVSIVPGSRKVRKIYMHRQILGLGPGDKLTGDHINHNTLDNRRENLRVATMVEQCQNRRSRSDSTTGIKGVTRRENGKFRVYLTVNKERIRFGQYNTLEEAAAIAMEKRKEFHGNFARYN